jgi:hypothetical protein
MRTINEQQLKDILDKHGKWLREEEGGELANLSNANLSNANLSNANLSNADLRYANLRNANLRYANLSNADLRSANLSSANLSYANLSSADLHYADLRSANLSSADLRSADLRYANLITFQFQQHVAYYTFDGSLRIGCICMPITEWAIGFEEIGKTNGYSEEQIEEYGYFINRCLEKFKAGK